MLEHFIDIFLLSGEYKKQCQRSFTFVPRDNAVYGLQSLRMHSTLLLSDVHRSIRICERKHSLSILKQLD